jgi:MOSC domain-containing protein YiiM
VPALVPSVFRRNVVVEGIDLDQLLARRFTLGGVEFEGTGEARPCHWMNAVVAPGAEDWLMGRGGLRAKVLTDGKLSVGPVALWLAQEVG